MQSIVSGLLEHIKKGTPQRGSFADLLLKAKDPKTGKSLSDSQMFPEIAALFFAGIDTTGHTGTFILCASLKPYPTPTQNPKPLTFDSLVICST